MAVVACLGTFGCGRQEGADQTHPAQGGAAQEISVDAHDFAFRPRTIGTIGDADLIVKLHNAGHAHHTFTVEDAGIDVELAPGESRTVRLTADRPHFFFCRFHVGSGMNGEICAGNGDCTLDRR